MGDLDLVLERIDDVYAVFALENCGITTVPAAAGTVSRIGRASRGRVVIEIRDTSVPVIIL